VEYALRDIAKPIGVTEWQTRIVEALPVDLVGSPACHRSRRLNSAARRVASAAESGPPTG